MAIAGIQPQFHPNNMRLDPFLKGDLGIKANERLNPLAGPSALRDLIKPQFHQVNLSIEPFIKGELGIKLDKGMQNH